MFGHGERDAPSAGYRVEASRRTMAKCYRRMVSARRGCAVLPVQLGSGLRRPVAVNGAPRVPYRDADQAGAEGVGDLGRHGAAIVEICMLPAHGWGAVGCTDRRVARCSVLYREVRATHAR